MSLDEVCQQLLVTDIKPESAQQIVQDITENRHTVLDLVEKLGPVLVNEDKVTRLRGVCLLSSILLQLPTKLVNEKQLFFITNFYCDRLKDHHTVIPAVLTGILALTYSEHLPKESPSKLLLSLQQNVNVQTQLKTDRYVVYQIYKNIVEKWFDNVECMGPDLVFGLISAIDSETDPNNLLLIFNFIPTFVKKISLGHLTEEMFELLAGYFPVDFTVAKKNDIIITRDDLSESLKLCLSAIPEFCDYCLPLIIEKLDSSLKVAKLDSYRLLQESCNVFLPQDLVKHLNELWKVMVRDLVPVTDEEVSRASLTSLKCLVSRLSNTEHLLMDFLVDVVSSARSLCDNVQENLYYNAMNILLYVSEASIVATKYVLTVLTPQFSKEFVKNDAQLVILLQTLVPFINCFKIFGLAQMDNFVKLMQFFVDCSQCCNDEVQINAFIGIHLFVDSLNCELRTSLYEIIVGDFKINKKSRSHCLQLFRKLSEEYPEEVLQHIVSSHLNIKDTNSDIEVKLDVISYILDLPQFRDLLLPDIVCNGYVDDAQLTARLNCLIQTSELSKGNRDFFTNLQINYDYLVSLLSLWNNGLIHGHTFTKDVNILDKITHIVGVIVLHLPLEVQQTAIQQFCLTFISHNKYLNPQASFEVTRSVKFLESVISSKEKTIIIPKLDEIAADIINLAVHSTDEVTTASACRAISYLTNKQPDRAVLTNSVANIVSQYLFPQGSDNVRPETKLNIAMLFIWTAKAVNIMGHPNVSTWNARLMELLSHPDVGLTVAKGFEVVLEELEESSRYPNFRLLYKQRLFSSLPTLLALYHSATEAARPNFLLAFTHMIQNIPGFVLIPEISKIIPLLNHCLDSHSQETVSGVLNTLKSLLEHRENILIEYMDILLPRLLKISNEADLMKNRIAALRCVCLYGFYPTHLLLPYKRVVIRSLLECVDDKKRLVRAEAVKARSRWYLVGAPGEDTIFEL